MIIESLNTIAATFDYNSKHKSVFMSVLDQKMIPGLKGGDLVLAMAGFANLEGKFFPFEGESIGTLPEQKNNFPVISVTYFIMCSNQSLTSIRVAEMIRDALPK